MDDAERPRNPSARSSMTHHAEAAGADHARRPMDHARAARRGEARRGALRGRRTATRSASASGTYLFDGPFRDPRDFAADIELKARSVDPHFFAVVDNASGPRRRLSGADADRPGQPGDRGRQHPVHAGDAAHGRGATEAQYLFARYVFDVLGNRRYEWKCNNLNAPSKRAAERFGFTFEGVFRQHMIVKGRNRDTAWFSMLDGEWPARKAAYERWLSPDNFDASGRQKDKPVQPHAEEPHHDADHRREAPPLRRTASRAGLLRDAEPLRCRLGEISRLARLSGDRDLERGHGVRRRASGRRRHARLCAEPHPRARRGGRLPAERRFRGRLRPRRRRASTRAPGSASVPASPASRSRIIPASATRRSIR